jgi:uncharacterized delta-60 repeat protein
VLLFIIFQLIIFITMSLCATQDGALDPTFGNNGQLITFFPANGTAQIPRNIRIQSDGKIIVSGRNNQPGGPCAFLNRYNIDGTLDTTFGIGGQSIVCFALATFYTADIVLQPNDQIIGGIVTPMAGNDTLVLTRLLANGSVDTSFGTNGFAELTIAPGGAARELIALALQTDGKPVAVSTTSSGTQKGVVARFLSNGAVDTSFGNDGVVLIDPTNYGGVALAFFGVQIQHDGKIVAFGDMVALVGAPPFTDNDMLTVFATPTDVFFVARFLPDGTLDPHFGANGVAITYAGTGGAAGVIQSDGKIVVTGSNATPPLYVVRYTADGVLDTSFANQGVGTYSMSGNIPNTNCINLQSDGKIVVSNSFSADNTANGLTFTAVRINTDGSLDTTFGNGGYVNTFVLGQPNCQTFASGIDTNGKIYVTGTVGNTQVGLVRYLVNSITYGPLSKALAQRYYNQNN